MSSVKGGRATMRGLAAAASLALCAAGIGTLTQGVAVPVQARLAQHRLATVFAQRLQNQSAAPEVASGHARHARRAHSPRAKATRLAALPTNGPIARLAVARLGISDIVLAGNGTHEQLALGPTMVKRGDEANPVTVLAAHRDTHFLFIRDLRAGDEVTLQLVTGELQRYRVTRFETVRWDKFAYPLDPAHPLLALTTCYPFGGTEYGGPWRRVAWAEQED